jgi:hypothetical protein
MVLTTAIAFDLSLLYFVAANVVLIVGYVLVIRHKARQKKERSATMTACILEYFRVFRVNISVTCIALEGNRHFTAVIECEPVKRFRLSHLIEMRLRDHVHASCSLKLDNVYWRFIVNERSRDDEYARDSLYYYEAEESTLETFEELLNVAQQRQEQPKATLNHR